MFKKAVTIYFLLAALWALPLFWAITTTLPFMEDVFSKSIRLNSFSNQLWSGDLYPRWIYSINDQLGGPEFIFYYPVSFYLASLLHFLSVFDPYGLLRLSLIILLETVLSGVIFYFWLKYKGFDEKHSLIGGILYIFSPNIYLFYVYTTIPATLVYAIFPALMIFTDKFLRREKYSFVAYSFIFSLLLMTSLPTLIVFMPILILYPLLISKNIHDRFIALRNIIIAQLLSIIIAAVYLIPAFLNLEYTDFNKSTENRYYYKNNFSWLDIAELSSVIFVVVFIIIYLLKNRAQDLGRKRELVVWLIITSCLLYMLTPLSIPVWILFEPILKKLQFPSRFYDPIIFTSITAVIFALSSNILDKQQKSVVIFIWLIGTLISYPTMIENIRPFQKYSEPNIRYEVLEKRIMTFDGKKTIWRDMYLPSEVGSNSADSNSKKHVEEILSYHDIGKVSVVSGLADVLLLSWFDQEKVIKIKINSQTENTTIRVRHFYFPGFKAKDETGKVDFICS